MTVPLFEDFDNPTGAFLNYDTYDAAQRTQLARQRHVDIRSFIDTVIGSPYTMFDLDFLSMTTLDALTMEDLETTDQIRGSEGWTAGTVGPQSDRNNFNGISLACTTGANTTFSTLAAIDISAFTTPDYISVALPAFPLGQVALASTFLDLTCEPTGNFSVGPTVSLPFSASTTTLTAGDCEARFPLSLLTSLSPPRVTGVRFRIQASASCTFRCLAVRCIASTWQYAPLDQNTQYGYLGATVPPTGSLTQHVSFPVAAAPITPTDWPIMLFSDGATGPLMVDMTIGAIITTGANTAENTFTLYFRELPITPFTINTLDTMTMESLDSLGQQPDYIPATLDDFASTHALTATVQWGTSGSVHIQDLATGTGYSFTGITFAPQTSYYLLVTLEADSIRVQIYPASPAGLIDFTTVVFDSTAVVDDNFTIRRRGRFGWYAQLAEGDTTITDLRPRSIVYGEYRSAGLTSVTPVDGARLFVSATPDTELYAGATATATGGVMIAPDVTKSRSGRCIRVTCDGNSPLQGLVTAPVRLENLAETEIEFDVLAPASAQLITILQNPDLLVVLYMPPFPANHWTHIKLPLSQIANQVAPGPYSLKILQSETGQNTWFIDNPSIHAKAVSWQGRGQAGDLRHVNDPAWVDFGDAINDPYNAALLGRGKALQIRGQVLAQDASITGVQILPKYAELGGFVWSDETPTYPAAPAPSFTSASAPAPHSATFDGSASTAAGGILSYYWTFGDGSYAYGATTAHTYETAGTYVANLTLIDLLDQKASVTHTVTVT